MLHSITASDQAANGRTWISPAAPAEARRIQCASGAAWDHFHSPRTVTLAPGATAHAVLEYRNAVVANCPPASVRTASTLRIYPPDQFRATHAMWDLDACAIKGKVFMSVRAIEPGVGTINSN